jgi:predicted O-methyltransferase YrrM
MPVNDDTPITEETGDYVRSVSLRPHKVLDALRDEMIGHARGVMTVSQTQAQLLQVLAQAMGARKVLDIGTFTGYSSTALALALPPDGKVVTLDVSEEFTAIARGVWQKAGVASKVELVVDSADRTMQKLLDAGQGGSFDMVLLDTSEKKDYARFYELALQLLRKGGLIAVDNTLYGGRVLPSDERKNKPDRTGDGARALIAFNEMVHRDERVTMVMLTIADGVTLAVKR